jgi:5-methylcytosine-specific restriction endonuclease McrA
MITEEKRAYQKAYREKHREKLREYQKQFWLDHKDRRGSENKSRYHANKERYAATRKAHYEANKERILAANKAYHAAHPEVVKRSVENQKRNNPESLRRAKKKYSDAHQPENVLRAKLRRARILGASIDTRGVNEFYKFVRSKKTIPCYYCGKVIRGMDVHVDHIVALSKSGNHAVENLCASCPTCNHSKSNKSLKDWDRHDQKFLPL